MKNVHSFFRLLIILINVHNLGQLSFTLILDIVRIGFKVWIWFSWSLHCPKPPTPYCHSLYLCLQREVCSKVAVQRRPYFMDDPNQDLHFPLLSFSSPVNTPLIRTQTKHVHFRMIHFCHSFSFFPFPLLPFCLFFLCHFNHSVTLVVCHFGLI